MVNKNHRFVATDIDRLGLYVRHPFEFAGYTYEDAKETALEYVNMFVICKNAMQSELLDSLWGKQ